MGLWMDLIGRQREERKREEEECDRDTAEQFAAGLTFLANMLLLILNPTELQYCTSINGNNMLFRKFSTRVLIFYSKRTIKRYTDIDIHITTLSHYN